MLFNYILSDNYFLDALFVGFVPFIFNVIVIQFKYYNCNSQAPLFYTWLSLSLQRVIFPLPLRFFLFCPFTPPSRFSLSFELSCSVSCPSPLYSLLKFSKGFTKDLGSFSTFYAFPKIKKRELPFPSN
jgi:hypothetical protein